MPQVRPAVVLTVLGGAALVLLVVKRKEQGVALRLGPPDTDSRNTKDLHPEFRPLAEATIAQARNEGIVLRVTSTARSTTTQARLLREGKTTVPFSYHNAGLAFDYIVGTPEVDRPEPWFPQGNEPQYMRDVWDQNMKRVADIGKAVARNRTGHRMIWGGDWRSFHDPFHLEWHPRLTLAEVRERVNTEGRGFAVLDATNALAGARGFAGVDRGGDPWLI